MIFFVLYFVIVFFFFCLLFVYRDYKYSQKNYLKCINYVKYLVKIKIELFFLFLFCILEVYSVKLFFNNCIIKVEFLQFFLFKLFNLVMVLLKVVLVNL